MMTTKKKKELKRKEKLLPRPPVVAVLGHVDHGKTTLLDKIRQTNVVAKEAGGITQHIGAYQVRVKGKKITFLDTPGHAAFMKMRARGVEATDLVVLVVAADEGVKPQTLESLKYIKAAKIPYLVAINKIDLPNVILDQVKSDLAKNEILVEGFGGDVVAVPVSAKTGKGIDELLEMILLLTEMADFRADPQAPLEAVVIESRVDRGRGPVATVLVKKGTLRLKEAIMADKVMAKVKAMFDDQGKTVKEAGPSEPVEVLGFKELPSAGSRVIQATEKEMAAPSQKAWPAAVQKRPETEPSEKEDKRKLKIILKADVAGTLEAILASFPDEVEVIFSGVGDVNESDVLLAATTKSLIFGFNVKIPAQIKKLAQTEKVSLRAYKVIYELLEEVEKKVLRILEPTIDEEIIGQAEIVAEFEINKERIAGAKVVEGRIAKGDQLQLKRGQEVMGRCRIKSLKQGKEMVEKAKKGEEFGAILSPPLDFRLGDMLVSFRPREEL
jgi:translation initiation factor IF-2